jgi:hypothetical protein
MFQPSYYYMISAHDIASETVEELRALRDIVKRLPLRP